MSDTRGPTILAQAVGLEPEDAYPVGGVRTLSTFLAPLRISGKSLSSPSPAEDCFS